jgi:hypothetical protein
MNKALTQKASRPRQAVPHTAAELDDRTAVDWNFIASEIGRALDSGVALDDGFVDHLAQLRFANARELWSGEGPGPTLDSSRRIVREVVEIHKLAVDSTK